MTGAVRTAPIEPGPSSSETVKLTDCHRGQAVVPTGALDAVAPVRREAEVRERAVAVR